MPFVKLDCGILDSTIWWDRNAREVFLTALLMAEPCELTAPMPQYETDSLTLTGWAVPPGWYGFVRAAGTGIIRRSGVEEPAGFEALKRLGSPEQESRTPDFEGRRLVRVDGGYIVLNFQKYRDKDYTAADRAARYRERKKRHASHGVTVTRHGVTVTPVTQAEAEAEAEAEEYKKRERRFAPPSLNALKQHAEEKGYTGFDALGFLSFYDSKGWMIGRSPMRSWKAAVASWVNRDRKRATAPPAPRDHPATLKHAPGWDRRPDEALAQEGVDLEALRKAREAEK